MKKSKWTRAQINMLLQMAGTGNVRMHAFEEVAKRTGRKTNSVRNYYYKHLAKEKATFASFSDAEVNNVLREIVLGTSRGESVRSICMGLSNGDKAKMLRFQNKYRAILKTAPQQIEDVKVELEGQGYLVKSPLAPYQTNFFNKLPKNLQENQLPNNVVTLPSRQREGVTDSDINNLFMGLMRLVKRQAEDSAKGQIESLKAEVERLKTQVGQTKN